MLVVVNEIKTFEERKEELLKLGKEKGFITYEQLALALKGLDLDVEALDDLYDLFNENNISVVSEDMTAKFCGIQLPQYHLSYNDGFDDAEIAEIKRKLVLMEMDLFAKAQRAIVRLDAPEGDVEYIC